MPVELVATRSPDSMSLERFPSLIEQGTQHVSKTEESLPAGYHCLVSLVQGELMVWDLGTPGGTVVNGARVTKAALRPGDTLSLGGTRFQVKYHQQPRRYLFGPRT
jgi:hypothetical protein